MTDKIELARQRLTEGGFTCVLHIRDEEYTSFERGVKPLLDFLKCGQSFKGAIAADKTVGAGAAHLYVLLGVEAVWANVISIAAEKVLAEHGIAVFAGERVPYIINRRGDGMCPIETAVADAKSSQHAYELIIAALQKLREQPKNEKTMQKIIVIGCPGSGKTTFSEKMKQKTDLPLFYLDAVWHKPDKTHIPREEFDARLGEILLLDSWIIDGNYSRTLERRMAACDTVFLFDLPVEVCLDGAKSRVGKKRYEMPWLETEFDPEFEQQIKEFPVKTLPAIYALLEKYSDKSITVFKSREEADSFLNGLA